MGRDALDVLIDAKALTDYSATRGIGTYLRNLLHHLAEVDGLNVSVLATELAPLPPTVRRVPFRRWAPGRWATAEHDLLLPLDLRRVKADVFHAPGLTPPRSVSVPWAVTLHDVIPLAVDQPGFQRERQRWHRLARRYARADAIIAISRHCADAAVSVLGADPARVHVVYHGVDARFQAATAAQSGDEPYVLSVGEYDHRKGYREAMAVIGALADRGLPHRLKVAGRIAPWVRDEVEALRAAAPRPDRIDLLGYVDHHAELPQLYQGADAMLIPSRHEGFGLPALEAMASGLPVVAFRNTATTEVLGDAAVLVDDGDVTAMAEAVATVLRSQDRRAELSARSLERAHLFDWRNCAAHHAEIYRQIAR